MEEKNIKKQDRKQGQNFFRKHRVLLIVFAAIIAVGSIIAYDQLNTAGGTKARRVSRAP